MAEELPKVDGQPEAKAVAKPARSGRLMSGKKGNAAEAEAKTETETETETETKPAEDKEAKEETPVVESKTDNDVESGELFTSGEKEEKTGVTEEAEEDNVDEKDEVVSDVGEDSEPDDDDDDDGEEAVKEDDK